MINSLQKIWNFSKKRQGSILTALVFLFLEGLLMMMKMWAVIYALDVLTGKRTVKEGIMGIGIMTIVCIVGTFFSSYVSQITSVKTGYGMVGDKRLSFGELLKNVHLGFFNDASVGKINAVLATTLSEIEAGASMALISVASGFLGAVAVAIGVLIYDWRIGVITVAGMIFYLVIVDWQIKISRKDAPARQKAQSTLSQTAISFLQGIKVTKAFSFKNGDVKLKEAIQGSCQENVRLSSRAMPSQTASQLCISLFETAILAGALFFYFQSDVFKVDKVIVIMVISFMAYASLNQAGSILSMIGILDNALKDTEDLEKTEKITCIQPIEKIKSTEIVFEHVSFAYDNNKVLHNISTTIKPGSFTAVIGPSGSGKSTFCQLIPRFWDVSSGTIRIGGADIRHVEMPELMEKISMVFQKVYLFEDTILNNIRFGKPDATLEEVRAAAKAARCDEFIMALPDGYETRITEGGGSLSGGEKQRISIARAILKDAPIVILDEATSALDAENEHIVLEAIDELTRNKTVIMIAHRMKSICNADHIIVIEKGEIVQEGVHEELIAEDGVYTRFMSEHREAAGWKVR